MSNMTELRQLYHQELCANIIRVKRGVTFNYFALPELLEAVSDVSEDQLEMLHGMVDGRRLRDISDLPFDLAI